MGMPITSFNIMNVLDKGGHKYDTDAVKRVLESFNLFAFIIHDPEHHHDFEMKISSQFDRLDHLTGDKLLFFALVNPPKEWLRHGSSRPYYKQLMNCSTTNKDMTAYWLANSLGIPYEKLPCLVISPNFRSKNFMWLRTCTSHVQDQLMELGYIAQRLIAPNFRSVRERSSGLARILEHPHIPERFDSLTERIKPLDLCEGSGSVSLESTLAKALADVLSFVSERRRTRDQEKRVQDTLNELNDKLKNLKQSKREQASYDEDNRTKLDDELEDLCIKLAMAIAYLDNRSENQHDLDLGNYVDINREFLEEDSRLILKTANLVLDTLSRPRQPTGRARSKFVPRQPIPEIEENSFDFTPGVICLAKVFEKEINLSVVHWIRDSLGIKLPDYFNRFQPQLPRNDTRFCNVNFNMEQDGRWRPPETGTSLRAFRAAGELQHLDKRWIHLLSNLKLLDNWELIKDQRNIAAHNRVVGKDSANAVRSALNNLSQNGIFEVLYDIKNTYRHDTPTYC